MKTRYSRVGRLDDDHADDGTSPAGGEWEVRGDARAETRFLFRTGITSVVPRLVVSDSGRGEQ